MVFFFFVQVQVKLAIIFHDIYDWFPNNKGGISPPLSY
jgi:hypothetical protein